MSGDFAVRRMLAEDAEGVVRAHEAAWDAVVAPIVGKSLGELAPLDARVDQARSALASAPADANGWVAERGGAIVGEAIAVGDELRDLYVVPDAWGTGVATALMDAALGSLRERGLGEAVLWVGEANGRARRFYEREGWRRDGTTRESPVGLRELRYRRAL